MPPARDFHRRGWRRKSRSLSRRRKSRPRKYRLWRFARLLTSTPKRMPPLAKTVAVRSTCTNKAWHCARANFGARRTVSFSKLPGSKISPSTVLVQQSPTDILAVARADVVAEAVEPPKLRACAEIDPASRHPSRRRGASGASTASARAAEDRSEPAAVEDSAENTGFPSSPRFATSSPHHRSIRGGIDRPHRQGVLTSLRPPSLLYNSANQKPHKQVQKRANPPTEKPISKVAIPPPSSEAGQQEGTQTSQDAFQDVVDDIQPDELSPTAQIEVDARFAATKPCGSNSTKTESGQASLLHRPENIRPTPAASVFGEFLGQSPKSPCSDDRFFRRKDRRRARSIEKMLRMLSTESDFDAHSAARTSAVRFVLRHAWNREIADTTRDRLASTSPQSTGFAVANPEARAVFRERRSRR